MSEVIFLLVLAGIWILVASIRDLQVREVPNWLSFSLIIFALSYRFFYSLFSENIFITSFYYSILLTAVFLGVPYFIYLFLDSRRVVLLKFFKNDENLEYFSTFMIFCFFILWLILDYVNKFASSIFAEGGLMFFYNGLIGLGVFFILGNVFYYGRIFAGGDAKLLIALGSVLFLGNSIKFNLEYSGFFVFLLLLVGAFYGIIWSLFLSVRNFRKFKKKFRNVLKKNKKFIYTLLCFGFFIFFLGFIESYFFLFGILFIVFPFLYVYAKSVDDVSMIKDIKVENLTEGDWLVDDINVGKKKIKAKWEGLSKKDIELIKKSYKFVKIRQGIPFVPVFLISYLIFLWFFYLGVEELIEILMIG